MTSLHLKSGQEILQDLSEKEKNNNNYILQNKAFVKCDICKIRYLMCKDFAK